VHHHLRDLAIVRFTLQVDMQGDQIDGQDFVQDDGDDLQEDVQDHRPSKKSPPPNSTS